MQTMFQKVTEIIKWVSIPALLMASVFSRFAASYELAGDLAICLGATILVQRAVWRKEYFWTAGFVSVAIVFSPIVLAGKIFLLMGVTCGAIFLVLLAVFRRQPLPVD